MNKHLVAAVLLVGGTAWAAPHKKPPKKTEKTAEQKEADRHFKSGVALYGEQKFSEALAEFERAYEIAPAPIVLYNIAACHRELSHYAEAVKYYRRFLDEGQDKAPADRIVAAKSELDGILQRIARVSVNAPDGAEVIVDGQSIGKMPLDMPLIVAPGEHKVVVHLEGKQDGDKNLRVASGDEVEVKIKLGDLPKEHVDVAEKETVVREAPPPEPVTPKHFAINAAFATNVARVKDTGVPTFGLGAAIGSRVEVAVDVTFVAYAVMPSLRVRLLGDRTSLHVIGAVPVSFNDGDMKQTFVAGAAGLGLRAMVTPNLALHLESYASFATKDHGVTFPAFVGGEVWF
ncbi:MAG TPA: PEGA domain-containing protein [Kofleriaceae bacterium]